MTLSTLSTILTGGESGHTVPAHNQLHQFHNEFILPGAADFWKPDASNTFGANLLMRADRRGAASGVASLDGSSLLPSSQLPTVAMRRDQPNLQTPITGIIIENYNDAAPFGLLTIRGGRGTQALPTPFTAAGQIVGALFFSGQYDTTYGHVQTVAGMRAKTTQAFSSGNYGTKLEFFTMPNTSGAGTVNVLTLDQDQSATFAGVVNVTGAVVLNDALTVTGVATFNGGIVAANAALIDGTVNLITGSVGQVFFQSASGMIMAVTRDAGVLTPSGQIIWNITAKGAVDSGHTIGTAGGISIKADAAFGPGSSPGRIELGTTPSGSISQLVRMGINNAGVVYIGATLAAAVLTFDGPGALVTFTDGTNIVAGTSTGTKIGTGTTQKLGFWNATPVAVATGWGTPTNTFLRTTFDTTTVTLPNLAARVGALISDLLNPGLIHS